MKIKHKDPLFKSVFSQVKDIDSAGTVRFYASIFNTPDRVNDIVVPGAYKKTIAENFKEIQHYKNHDSRVMPAVIREMVEDDNGLLVTSKMILNTQAGKETYEEYRAMAEAGKSMAHSIGYVPVKVEPTSDFNYLKEILLLEVSTLTTRPAHPGALTVDVKTVDYLRAMLKSDLPDDELEELEKVKNEIEALLKSRSRVTTPPAEEPLTQNDILKILNV
jgi:HK97 family phage prohead protease